MGSLYARANFGIAIVSLGYNASDTAIVLTAGQGSKLPSSGTAGFLLTWWNSTDYTAPEDDPNVERVLCTNRATDNLTVTRGQDGTAASAKNIAGKTYKMMVSWGKGEIDQVEQSLQTGGSTYAADSGSGTAYVVALDPVPAAYTAGMMVRFKAANSSTGSATLNVNALGAKNLVTKNGQPVGTGDLRAGDVIAAQYDGANFQVLNAVVQPNDVQTGSYIYGGGAGSANAYTATMAPVPTAYVTGMFVVMKASFANTAAATINVNGLGVKAVVDSEGSALVGGELKSGAVYICIYDGTSFQVQNVLAFSEIWLYAGNGHGATNTKIRRLSTIAKNIGNAVTYADSSTLGASFTINKAGIYSMNYREATNNSADFGISVNSAQLTTGISGITSANRIGYCLIAEASGGFPSVPVTLYLNAGDVVRPHTSGNQTNVADSNTDFRISRIG